MDGEPGVDFAASAEEECPGCRGPCGYFQHQVMIRTRSGVAIWQTCSASCRNWVMAAIMHSVDRGGPPGPRPERTP